METTREKMILKLNAPRSATANLRSLSVLPKLSVSTDDLVVVTDEEWQARVVSRANAEFYRRNWRECGAPGRASERIASGQFSGEEWHKANRKLETMLSPRAGVLLALIGNRGPGKTQLGVCAMDRLCCGLELAIGVEGITLDVHECRREAV